VKTKIKITRLHRKQSGATLITVLIILLLVSLMAAFSAKNTIFQEKMAQAVLIQNHTLQAAESGIIQAEHWLKNNPAPLFKAISQRYGTYNMIEECEDGICAMSVSPASSPGTHFWAKASFWESCVAEKQCVEGEPVGQWHIKPRYVIEDYGYINTNAGKDVMARNTLQEPGTKLMRITAWAELGPSHSIAQSIVQR